MELFKQINDNYEVRTEMYDGREHLVVPATMMVEGVHEGSGGPMLHLADELGRYPESWNGIPVVVTHPADVDGQNISANSPQVLDAEIVGRVFNTQMDGEKLKSEVWIDSARLEEISPEALAAIQAQKPLDVSVGVFSDEENVSGTYENEEYGTVARNLRPDHLALLPGEEGACSWNDGCGIRSNSNENKNDEKGGKNVKKETLQMIKSLRVEGYSISEIGNHAKPGYKERIDQVWEILNAKGTDNTWYYLEELFDKYLVYTKSGKVETQMYKQDYTMTDNTIELVGLPVEVRKDTKFVVMEKEKRSGFTRTKFNNNSNKEVNMSEEKKTPCCEDLVNELITNKRTKFDEKDKEMLLTLSEELLNKLIPDKEVKTDPKKEKTPEPLQVNAEQALKVLKESLQTSEDFIKILPNEMQDSMRSGLKLHEAERVKMVKAITEGLKDIWPEDYLKAADMETLVRIHKSIPEVADYSLISTPKQSTNEEEHLLPAGVELDKE